MPRKKPMSLRRRAQLSGEFIPVTTVEADGRIVCRLTGPDGARLTGSPGRLLGHVQPDGTVKPREAGLTQRADPTACSEAAGCRVIATALVRPFKSARDAAKFVAYWRKRGLSVRQQWRSWTPELAEEYRIRGWGPRGPGNAKLPPPVGEPLPARDDYRDEPGLYVYTVSGGTSDQVEALARDTRVARVVEARIAEGSGGNMAYRRLQDQRKADKRPRALDYNHGAGFGNTPDRRLSAP